MRRRKEKSTPVGVSYGRPWIDQWRPGPHKEFGFEGGGGGGGGKKKKKAKKKGPQSPKTRTQGARGGRGGPGGGGRGRVGGGGGGGGRDTSNTSLENMASNAKQACTHVRRSQSGSRCKHTLATNRLVGTSISSRRCLTYCSLALMPQDSRRRQGQKVGAKGLGPNNSRN